MICTNGNEAMMVKIKSSSPTCGRGKIRSAQPNGGYVGGTRTDVRDAHRSEICWSRGGARHFEGRRNRREDCRCGGRVPIWPTERLGEPKPIAVGKFVDEVLRADVRFVPRPTLGNEFARQFLGITVWVVQGWSRGSVLDGRNPLQPSPRRRSLVFWPVSTWTAPISRNASGC
jgi:hypothetical protein